MEEEYNLDDLTILETPKKIKHSSTYWGCAFLLVLSYGLAFIAALILFGTLTLLFEGKATVWTALSFAGNIVALIYIIPLNQTLSENLNRIHQLDITRARIRQFREQQNAKKK